MNGEKMLVPLEDENCLILFFLNEDTKIVS